MTRQFFVVASYSRDGVKLRFAFVLRGFIEISQCARGARQCQRQRFLRHEGFQSVLHAVEILAFFAIVQRSWFHAVTAGQFGFDAFDGARNGEIMRGDFAQMVAQTFVKTGVFFC